MPVILTGIAVGLLALCGAAFLLISWIVLGINVLKGWAAVYFPAVTLVTAIATAVIGWLSFVALIIFMIWQLTVFADRHNNPTPLEA